MAKVYDGIDADMAAWIERQPVFFVATAPLATTSLDGLPGLRGSSETPVRRDDPIAPARRP
jgi:hypothetical protein